jgi:hypothetical protein
VTTLNFIQQILTSKKKHFKSNEIIFRRTEKYYGELAVKNVYHLFKDNQEVREYLPAEEMDLGRFPDRIFTWGILYTLNYAWADELYHKVVSSRNQLKMINPF